MIKVTDIGSITGVTTTDLRNNLRLPPTIDEALLTTCLAAAVKHVEEATGQAIVSKNVTQAWIDNAQRLYLKYQADAVTTVKLADVDIIDECTIIKDVMPSVIILPTLEVGTNVVQVDYTCASHMTPNLKNVIIMIASMYYNNPEGLGPIDQARINNILNQNLNRI